MILFNNSKIVRSEINYIVVGYLIPINYIKFILHYKYLLLILTIY